MPWLFRFSSRFHSLHLQLVLCVLTLKCNALFVMCNVRVCFCVCTKFTEIKTICDLKDWKKKVLATTECISYLSHIHLLHGSVQCTWTERQIVQWACCTFMHLTQLIYLSHCTRQTYSLTHSFIHSHRRCHKRSQANEFYAAICHFAFETQYTLPIENCM